MSRIGRTFGTVVVNVSHAECEYGLRSATDSEQPEAISPLGT